MSKFRLISKLGVGFIFIITGVVNKADYGANYNTYKYNNNNVHGAYYIKFNIDCQ